MEWKHFSWHWNVLQKGHVHELNIMYEFMLYVEQRVRLCNVCGDFWGMGGGKEGVSGRME